MYEVRTRKQFCIMCYRAMALLLVHDLAYNEVLYDSDENKSQMVADGLNSWPMIYKDGRHVGGYSDLLLKLTGSDRFGS